MFCDQCSYSDQNTQITETFFSPWCPKMSQICIFQSPTQAKKDQCTHANWELLFDQSYYAEIVDFSTLDIFSALFQTVLAPEHPNEMDCHSCAEYESIATVGEIRVWWRADFQSGSRVLKKVF